MGWKFLPVILGVEMKKYELITVLLPVFFLFLIAEPAAGDKWELSTSRPGVKVYTRPVQGSSFMELKGVTKIQTAISAVVALLDDVKFHQEWVPNSGGVSILKRLNPKEAYVRGIILAPWPFYDRDMIARFLLRQDPDTLIITIHMTSISDYHPLQKGYVRVARMSGLWKITPMADDVVEIIYQIHIDPGGVLPAFLVNRFALQNVYQTLNNMRQAVKKEKYKSTVLPYITELGE